MARPLIGLVMAGGTGTRLYPASRSDRPKQLLSFGGERSLLRQAIDRLDFADEAVVVTRAAHADRVREQVPEATLLVEPEAKDTGPALVYAAHRIRSRVGDCVLCCLPSDHRIEGAFADTMRTAAEVAVETNGLITIGIEPDRPATGYGYIRPGSHEGDSYVVDSFHEKPDRSDAERFVKDSFYWNAGLFAWTPAALLREARDSPLAPLVDALDAEDPVGGFGSIDSISIDYAVLERTDEAYLVPASFEWDDLGTWDAFERVLPDGENAVLGDALALDASGNVIASDEKHVSVVGVSDLVVAAYDDRVLVVPKADAQRVREVVSRLQDDDRF